MYLLAAGWVRAGYIVNRSPGTSFTPGDALDGNECGWSSGSGLCSDFESGHWSMTELCERYGITRPTGYKWVARYRDAGRGGARGAQSSAAAVSASDVGADRGADPRAPATSTAGVRRSCVRVLADAPSGAVVAGAQHGQCHPERHGLLRKHRRRTQVGASRARSRCVTERPNQVWPADFKGQFRTGDGRTAIP